MRDILGKPKKKKKIIMNIGSGFVGGEQSLCGVWRERIFRSSSSSHIIKARSSNPKPSSPVTFFLQSQLHHLEIKITPANIAITMPCPTIISNSKPILLFFLFCLFFSASLASQSSPLDLARKRYMSRKVRNM